MRTASTVHAAIAAVTAALLLSAPGAARAQDGTLDTSFAVRAGARIAITNQSGAVIVHGWDRNQVRIVAEYDRARVQIEERAGVISIRSDQRRGHDDVDYTITVPRGTGIEVNGHTNDVDVTGVCGAVSVSSVSGDVNVQCAEGDLIIQAVSGDVVVADARGGVEAGTISGDVDVRGARGPVSVHSVSGDVTLSQIEGVEISAQTVNGEILYSGRIADGGRYRFESHNGDVAIHVAGTLNATIAVETFNGEFECDFPIEIQPGTTVGKKWEFRQGTGSARLRLSSFNGGISLRRGAPRPSREE